MDLSTLLPALFIAIGFLFMLVSVLKFKKLLRLLFCSSSSDCECVFMMSKLHLALMVFFLLGYGAVFFSLLMRVHFVSNFIVGAIFMFGAIFVWLGVLMQDRMLRAMIKGHLQTVKVLVSAVEVRDPYTMGHSEHVANLLLLLFDSLPKNLKRGLDKELLKYAGFLHDIGKIGIPEVILNKCTPLSETECEALKNHAAIAESILNNVDGLKVITKWILYHHERIDGSGYYNLPGGDIPLVSRMLAIADTYSSLVTDRVYRKNTTHEEAIEIMKKVAGTQLDNMLVEIFCSLDKMLVEDCKPERLHLTHLVDVTKAEQYIEQYTQTHISDTVLSRNVGIIAMLKLLHLARRENGPLTIAKLVLPGIQEAGGDNDYHIADCNTTMVGDMMNQNIRKSDVLCRLKRDEFLVLFPQCTKKQAEKLLDRIDKKMESSDVVKSGACEGKINRTYMEYIPSFEESYEKISAYLNSIYPDYVI